MKQVIQNYKTGELQLVEVPPPGLRKNFVLVKNINSLISVGTEKYMIEMAKKSLIGKARERPELVKHVIAKVKTEGIFETYKAVMTRLDMPVPLGYSSAGIVIEIGEGVEEFKKGNRVACAGSGYASHAEIVCVPQNLCVKIPENVDFESASFVALGGIALEAIRLANPSLGDKIAVIGLGLLGQITVQLLKANGCHVFGIDIDEEKVKMAIESGLEEGAVSGKEDVIRKAKQFASSGFDSVIIMAATKSNEPLEIAAEIAREKGKIIACGLVGLEIPRKIFFEKELEFAVSRAWGAGIFDPLYVEKNIDYPYAYARWTAKRNMEEFLFQVAKGNVNVKKLITHRFKIGEALNAYDMILKNKEPYMGVIIEYPEESERRESVRQKVIILHESKEGAKLGKLNERYNPMNAIVGFIGAGLFSTGTILPILKKLKSVRLKGVSTATGYKGEHVAKKFGFEYFTTDYKEILNDPEINIVFIMTRHSSHAYFVCEALKTGKNVFVEKPLCVNKNQLNEIINTYNSVNVIDTTNSVTSTNAMLMVGFNRRFSPFSEWLKGKFKLINEPLSINIIVNAGYVPSDHWSQDSEEGGRIIGEVCHFIDLIDYFTDSIPERVYAECIESNFYKSWDNVSINLKMRDGSIANILYVASGDKSYPRERVEIFGGGAVGIIDNFKKAEFIYKGRKERIKNWLSVDRGYRKEIELLLDASKGGNLPFNFKEYVYTTLTTFAIEESLNKKEVISLNIT